MFENSGEKIKQLAKIMFYVLTICFIIIGISYFFIEVPEASMLNPEPTPKSFYVFIGLVFIFAGPFAAYASSLLVYGFGELVANSKLNKNNSKQSLTSNNDNNYVDTHSNHTYQYNNIAKNQQATSSQIIKHCPHCNFEMKLDKECLDDTPMIICPECDYLFFTDNEKS